MILVIDNFDSFTYNLVQYINKLGFDTIVKRNNEITIKEIENLSPDKILISPGPGTPDNAGISIETIEYFKDKLPIFGVCLGHQSIGRTFGAKIIRAKNIYHGKTSPITHDGKGVFTMLPQPLTATRYHSLVIDRDTLPDELEITAVSEDNEIMGIRHKKYNIEGVQFHPESIASQEGYALLLNFLRKPSMENIIKPAIKKLFAKEDLTLHESELVMNKLTEGNVSPAAAATILTALALKGESIEEITGFAKIMRNKATTIKKPAGKKVIDTCGTGGDSSGTFNISTIAAFVAAGAGAIVAKHGNRSITSKCGSADLLEALGVNIDITPEKISESLDKIGIGFLFAQKLHDAMKHIIGVRKAIGVRTIFNILGPLTNPANADYQVIGVFDGNLTEKIGQVMSNLGIKKGMVVHGSDGLDEITVTGTSQITEISDKWIKTIQFDPGNYGFSYATANELLGGEIETNKQIAIDILNGKIGPKRDIVVINAAAAIISAELAVDFKDAITLATEAIDNGNALSKLNQLIEFSNS